MFLTMVPSTLWADKLVTQAIREIIVFLDLVYFPYDVSDYVGYVYCYSLTCWGCRVSNPLLGLLDSSTQRPLPLLPPNQLLHSVSPSQHHHPSGCSNQKQIHLGVFSFLIIQSSILSPICLVYLYPKLGPKLQLYLSSSNLFSVLLFLWLAITDQMTIS